MRGIRGAITIHEDVAEQVWSQTALLVQQMVKENQIPVEEIVSVTISTTPDITSAFPAKAVRTMEGWEYVPTMCMHEMNVPNALPLCIRVLMHANIETPQKDVQHVYLNNAVQLRPDLVK
jgi:chorismate mutase